MLSYLKVPKTLRFATSGNTTDPTKLLIALHGYGQLIPFFSQKFKDVPSDYLVIVPEGPHRFYLNGTSGRVGASWMTKEERENDIQDNINYLDTLLEEVIKKYPSIEATYVLGFSQGGATATRWVAYGNIKPAGLLLWATVFPPDLTEAFPTVVSKKVFIIGSADEYYQGEDAEQICREYEDRSFEIIRYEGNHAINSTILNSILSRIT